eukprot:4009949-Alexandrium_andersonii.AAC.1
MRAQRSQPSTSCPTVHIAARAMLPFFKCWDAVMLQRVRPLRPSRRGGRAAIAGNRPQASNRQ